MLYLRYCILIETATEDRAFGNRKEQYANAE
jgi:hypothetical protein